MTSFVMSRSRKVGQAQPWIQHKHNLPERTGRGDAMSWASISIASSFSSSGEIVSSDWTNKQCRELAQCIPLTIGLFLGFRVADLRLPLTVTATDAVVSSPAMEVTASISSTGSSSDATSSCDWRRQCVEFALPESLSYRILFARLSFPLTRGIDLIWICCRRWCC